jgi:hypothetical protein
MTLARGVLFGLSFMLLAGTPGWTQDRPERSGFWASVQFGYGALDYFSDQEPQRREGTFALAFDVGGTPSRSLRLGVELGGWLMEASDVWDPTTGVSISQLVAFAEVYPWPARGVFLKAGAGRATYTNHHPLQFGSSGWGGTVGIGWDVPVSRRIALTPVVSFSQGGLGSVANLVQTVTDREYRVLDLRIAVTYHQAAVAGPPLARLYLRHEVPADIAGSAP